jgi:uncharacterized protein
MTTPAPRTERTRLRRHPDRAVPERIEEFLLAGTVAHLALVADDGAPRLIPFLYHYEDGIIYIHGSPANATLRLARDGRPVTVAVTALDDLIASKTAADHSANYRSVVAYGRGHEVTDTVTKRRVLDAMTARLFPGREVGRDYAPATDGEFDRMALVAIEIEEASAKMRSGPAKGPHDDDSDFPGSTFLRSLRPDSASNPAAPTDASDAETDGI